MLLARYRDEGYAILRSSRVLERDCDLKKVYELLLGAIGPGSKPDATIPYGVRGTGRPSKRLRT